MTELILASASPRRRALMELLRLPFRVMVADVDEDSITDPDPTTNVIETARLKAMMIARRCTEPAMIIASDTTVAWDGRMLNKPADEAEARAMLRALRGRVHHVHTGLVLLSTATGQTVTDVATIPVPMRDYSDEEIAAYIATGDPMDKAGAYAIQHPKFQPVVYLGGCYAGVMGFPLCHLTRALRQMGVDVKVDIAAACQQYIQYDCPVYEIILGGKPETERIRD